MGQKITFGDIPAVGSGGQATSPAVPTAPAATPGDQPNFGDIPAVTLSGPLGEAMNVAGRAHKTYTDAIVKTASGLDPRTSQGRQNLAGAAGAAAMAVGTEGLGTLPWIARLLATPSGAALGGMAAEGGEQLAGNKPQDVSQVGWAGATQGAYDLAGKAILWPLRAVATRFVGARQVAKQARAAVDEGLASAKTAATDAMDAVRERGRQFLGGEKAAVRQSVRSAQATAARDIELTTTKNAREMADVQAIYDELKADAPSVLDAGKKVRAVVQPRDTPEFPRGPAQRALDQAGAKVSEAAQTGPPIAMAPVRAALDAMTGEARPTAIFGNAAKDVKGVGFLSQIRQAKGQAAAGIRPGAPGAESHLDNNKMIAAIAKELGLSENHPLPGILAKVASSDAETLTFAEAHQLKKLLDESVNWDRAASKHVEQITKGLRSTLREAMSVHQPYNAATAAFAQVVPLYRKSVGKQLIKAAQEDPDKVVRLLSAKDPARAQRIKDLLVGQAAEGGDHAAGLQAWHAVQSHWVYNNIIRGGAKDLSKRLATALTENPEFSKVVLGDQTARQVLSNIDHIGQAYLQAEQMTGERLLAAKTAGQASVTAAKDAGAARLESARHTVADATRVEARAQRGQVDAARETREKFRGSSIARYAEPLSTEHSAADIARVAALGPKTFTGALSLIRLLTGPKRAELIEWAAYSNQNTQRLVQALTSDAPPAAVADLLREMSGHVGLGTSATSPGDGKSARVPAAGSGR
jgi:hypothetical protein